jgi:hypothetical protein
MAVLTNAANHGYRTLDQQLSQYSAKKRQKNDVMKMARQVAIERMVASDDEFNYMCHYATRITVHFVVLGFGMQLLVALYLYLRVYQILKPEQFEDWWSSLSLVVVMALMGMLLAKMLAVRASRHQLRVDISIALTARQKRAFETDKDNRLIPRAGQAGSPQVLQSSAQP